jgi:hypothetical protein
MNLTESGAIGITVPLPLSGRADEIIELSAGSSSLCSAVRGMRRMKGMTKPETPFQKHWLYYIARC